MLRISLTSGYVCICSGEYDPIGPSLLEDIRNLLRITNVGIFGAQPADIVIGPFARERFAEQTSRPEDGYPHAAIPDLFVDFRLTKRNAETILGRNNRFTVELPINLQIRIIPR